MSLFSTSVPVNYFGTLIPLALDVGCGIINNFAHHSSLEEDASRKSKQPANLAVTSMDDQTNGIEQHIRIFKCKNG